MRSLYHIVFQTYIQFVCRKTLLTDLVMAGVMVAEGMLFSGSLFNFNLVLTFWYCYAIRFWNGFWRLNATLRYYSQTLMQPTKYITIFCR